MGAAFIFPGLPPRVFGQGDGSGGSGGSSPGANLLSSLMAHWKLNESSAGAGAVTRNDSHGSNHLTDNNTTASGTGKLGNGAQLAAASSEYLSIADNAALSTGDIDFTVAFWCKFDTAPASNMGVVSKYGGAGNREWNIRKSSANRFGMEVSSDGTTTTLLNYTSALTVTAGVWYFVIGWHDSVGNALYMQVNNDVISTTGHAAGVFDSAAEFNIGRFGGSFYMDGIVDSVSFWKRTLTEAERAHLYNSGSGRDYPFT